MPTILDTLHHAGVLSRADVDRLRVELASSSEGSKAQAKALVESLVGNHDISAHELAEVFIKAEIDTTKALRVLKPKIHVLLVEDNPADVELTRRALIRQQRFEIVGIAHDGDEALAFLRNDPPFEDAKRADLIILDLDLPRRDGFEILAELKSDTRLEATPVIVLSGTSRNDAAQRAFATRAVSFIQRPTSLASYRRMAAHLEVYWSQISALP